MRTACYPGSFDPITNGHVDIALRALQMFDKLYVIVSENSEKSRYMFTTSQRVEMCKKVFENYPNIEVIEGKGLTAYQAKDLNCQAIIRGLRMVSDYEYEVQFAEINSYLAKDVDMVFLMARKEFSFISSTRVKEIHYYNGDISNLVPKPVLDEFKKADVKKIK